MSKKGRKLRNLLRPWGPCPYHLPPPAPKPLDPPRAPALGLGVGLGASFLVFGPNPPQSAIPPLRPPPTLSCNQGPWFTALSTRPAPVGNPPTPQGILQKTSFFFCERVRKVKNTAQVAKFAPSLGPVPLPPTPPEPQPLDPPVPSPCTHPHPTGYPSKKNIFLLFVRVRNVKDTTQVAKSYAPPNPLLQPRPLVYRPVHQASSGGYPPTPQGILQKTSFFFFLNDASCEICSVPGARAPTTYTPGTKAPGPRLSSPCTPPTPQGILQKNRHFSSFCTR